MKKSKIFHIYLIIFFVLIFSIYYLKEKADFQPSEIMLIKSFDNSGAKMISSEAYFWGKITNNDTSLEDLQAFSIKFANDLGVVENSTYSNKLLDNDLLQKVEIKCTGDKNTIFNISVQLKPNRNNNEQGYISVYVIKDLTNSSLNEIKKKVKSVFNKYDIDVTSNFCITGTFEGKLEEKELEAVSNKVFSQTNARKVEGINEENLISISAFSPKFKDSVIVNQKKINLNLAIRYNSYENKTYLWLATPVITTEY